jgi:two-component system sensor histidine kinase BaeS
VKIRARIGWVAVAVVAPQLLGLLWWDSSSRHRAAAAVLGELAAQAVDGRGAREACLADPEGWAEGLGDGTRGRHKRGHRGGDRGGDQRGDHHGQELEGVAPPELRAHADAAAVPLGSATLDLTELAEGEPAAISPTVWGNQVAVAVRTGWGGGCEVVTAHGTTVPGFLGSVLPASPLWLGPLAIVATVMWLAVAPPVNRIRRLTEAVRAGQRRVAMDGDDEIAELSRAFQEEAVALEGQVALREAREAALRDFVANTAHDVRIPLTVLRGHLAALEEGRDEGALRDAMGEVHYLGALLDNLAAQARMEAAGPHAPFDLADVVERVVARHAPIARRKGVALAHGVPGAPLVVVGDLTLAEQALSNLVYNAVHHNRAGGHVAITLDADGGAFEVVVADDGPGVPAAELSRLTERGYQGSAARGRDGRGAGLGLSIVARVAEAHGWSFALRSREEGGLEAVLSGPSSAPRA